MKTKKLKVVFFYQFEANTLFADQEWIITGHARVHNIIINETKNKRKSYNDSQKLTRLTSTLNSYRKKLS